MSRILFLDGFTASVPQFREVFLTRRYLGITMEYAAGGDMFDFFVRNKAFVNVKVCHSSS